LAEAEFEDLPDGMTAEQMRELQYLAGRQQPGALRPDFGNEVPVAGRALTEEEMAELRRLAAG
jgi:hypothetical protein